MDEKRDKAIIVIGRQFGSGGRSIGRNLARRLGYKYYDTELLKNVARRYGFSEGIFRSHEEKRPSVLRSMLQGTFGIADNFHEVSISSERLYAEQSKVIREIASEGGCVIVGRTADYILRDFPNMTSIFLHAPVEYRCSHIVDRGEAINYSQAIEMAKKRDKARENYYNYFTGTNLWGKASNYDLCLDSSCIDEEAIVNIIISYIKDKFKRNK